MKPDAKLPVIRACHEFTVWLLPKIGKFRRDLRFTLGDQTEHRTGSELLTEPDAAQRGILRRIRHNLLSGANTAVRAAMSRSRTRS